MMTELADLARAGWTRRNVACEPRLGEAVRQYEAMGLEVLLVPVTELVGEGTEDLCVSCFEGDAGRHRVIFTRPGGPGGNDDLF